MLDIETGDSDRRRGLARRIVSAVSLNSVTSVTTLLLGGVANIGVARTSGPDGFAEFVFVNMVIFVTDSISTFSIPLAVAKRVAKDTERRDRRAISSATTTTAVLLATVGALSGLAVSLFMPFLERQFEVAIDPAFRIGLPVVLAFAGIGSAAWAAYLGLLRQGRGMVINIIGPATMIAYLGLRNLGVSLPLWGAPAVMYMVPGLIAIPMMWFDGLFGRLQPGYLKHLLRESVPAASFTFLVVASTWADRAVVGLVLGTTSLGLYAAATTVVQAVLRIPTNLAYVFVAAGAHAGASQVDRARRLNEMEVRSLAIFSSFLMSIVIVGAPKIITVLFGPGFANGITPTIIMTPVVLAAALTIPLLSALMASPRSSTVVRLVLITFPIRVGLLVGFTLWAGLRGTAAATVIAEVVLAVAAARYARAQGLNVPAGMVLRELPTAALAIGLGLGAAALTRSTVLGFICTMLVFIPKLWTFFREIRASVNS